jgi:hypothetical protein
LLEFETGWSRHSWSPALHSLKAASGGRPVHMSGLPGCMVILSREASWVQLSGTLPLRLLPVTVLQAGKGPGSRADRRLGEVGKPTRRQQTGTGWMAHRQAELLEVVGQDLPPHAAHASQECMGPSCACMALGVVLTGSAGSAAQGPTPRAASLPARCLIC